MKKNIFILEISIFKSLLFNRYKHTKLSYESILVSNGTLYLISNNNLNKTNKLKNRVFFISKTFQFISSIRNWFL